MCSRLEGPFELAAVEEERKECTDGDGIVVCGCVCCDVAIMTRLALWVVDYNIILVYQLKFFHFCDICELFVYCITSVPA